MYPSGAEIEKALLSHILRNGGPSHEVPSDSTYDPLAKVFGLSDEE